ncbi:MAG: HAD-IB family phosphatase [Butyrivibrio sp.]|nr:HAD-IB family phosphatase [Butyrivibrio sp.]
MKELKRLRCGEAICYKNINEYMIKNIKSIRERFYPMTDTKVVVFDFDGTLTKTENNYTSWQLIWLYLGYSLDDCGRFYKKYVNQELSHQEWCDITAGYFIEKGLTVSDVEKISRQITLIDGTISVIKKMKERGVKVYICSGSIDTIIENVFGDEKSLFDGISCNHFLYDRNQKLNLIKGTKFDFEGKAKYIKRIVDENRISPTECLFVGNSDNDVWAYESGVKTLVVNPHKIMGMDRKVWRYYMEKMVDLHEILPYIFPLVEI